MREKISFGPNSPIHLAAISPKFGDLQQLLITADKSEIDASGELANTPLHLAAEFGNLEAFNSLLAAGADIYLKNIEGDTLLHSAVKGGNPQIVASLIDLGLDPFEKNSEDKSSFDISRSLWNQEDEAKGRSKSTSIFYLLIKSEPYLRKYRLKGSKEKQASIPEEKISENKESIRYYHMDPYDRIASNNGLTNFFKAVENVYSIGSKFISDLPSFWVTSTGSTEQQDNQKALGNRHSW